MIIFESWKYTFVVLFDDFTTLYYCMVIVILPKIIKIILRQSFIFYALLIKTAKFIMQY